MKDFVDYFAPLLNIDSVNFVFVNKQCAIDV